jgi:hypothetical protein
MLTFGLFENSYKKQVPVQTPLIPAPTIGAPVVKSVMNLMELEINMTWNVARFYRAEYSSAFTFSCAVTFTLATVEIIVS